MKFLLIITAIYLFMSISQVWSESSEEPVGGMYFSYFSNKDEIAKLEFNIAETNITNIQLYIKYYNRGLKEVNISCGSADLSRRKDFHQISITCNKLGLRHYLVGNINSLQLKKRSENGIIGNLKMLRIAHKNSFYEQLKKNPSYTIEDHEEFIVKEDKASKEREKLAREKAIEEKKMAKERAIKVEKELRRQDKLAREEKARKRKAAKERAKKEELALLAAEKERERKEKILREKSEEKEKARKKEAEKKREQEEKIARKRAEKVELALLEREKERMKQQKLIEKKVAEDSMLAKEAAKDREKKEELALLAAEKELKRQENLAREENKKAEEINIDKEREQLEELITEKKELEKERKRQKNLAREKLVTEEIKEDKEKKVAEKIAEEEKIAQESIQLEKFIKEKEETKKELKRQKKLARKKAEHEEKANKAVEKELAIWDLKYLEILLSDVKDFVSKNKNAFPPMKLVKIAAPIKFIIKQKSISTIDVDKINTFSNFIMENSDFISYRNKKLLEREKKNLQIIIILSKKLQVILDFCIAYIENNPLADEAYEVTLLYNSHKDNLKNKDKNILENSIKEINEKLFVLGLKKSK